MEWIDTHCHLSDPAFDADRGAARARAARASVVAMLDVATAPEGWPRSLALAQAHPEVRAALGFHPNEAGTFSKEALAELKKLFAEHPGVAVAVGETGLDTFRKHCPVEVQGRAFQAQLDLAAELDVPFILHCRSAERELLRVLKAQREKLGRPLKGVWHCFSAAAAFMHEAVALGLHLGFGGIATYPRAHEVREAARQAPPDRLLLETDAPYLPPQPWRGQRNEPAYVVESAKKLAEVRGAWVEEIARLSSGNARRLFGTW